MHIILIHEMFVNLDEHHNPISVSSTCSSKPQTPKIPPKTKHKQRFCLQKGEERSGEYLFDIDTGKLQITEFLESSLVDQANPGQEMTKV